MSSQLDYSPSGIKWIEPGLDPNVVGIATIGGAAFVGLEILSWANTQLIVSAYTFLGLGVVGVAASICLVLYLRRLRRVGLDVRGITFQYASRYFLLEWALAEPPEAHVVEGKFGPNTVWRMRYPGADGHLRYHDGVPFHVLEAILSHPNCPWRDVLATLVTSGPSYGSRV